MKLCCNLYFSHDIFSKSTSISIVLKYHDANTRQIIFYLPQIECGAGINPMVSSVSGHQHKTLLNAGKGLEDYGNDG